MIFIGLSIFSAILTTLYIILISSYIRGWRKIPPFKNENSQFRTWVSVVIAARNEEENIGKLLDCISKQDFEKERVQVIVVDDNSNDLTMGILQSYKNRISDLQLVNLSNTGMSGKKQALEEGIKISTGELIITTDADCSMGPSWLSSIVSFFEKEKPDMIIAPVLFHQGKSFIKKFQEMEFSFLSGSTAGAAGNNRPIMCNGANLAFSRKKFFEIYNPFNNEIVSGDDIFLMLKLKSLDKKSVRFLKSAKAVVTTNSAGNFKEFLNQRIRWVSKGRYYSDMDLNMTSYLIFYFNLFLLLSLVLTWLDIRLFYVFLFMMGSKSIIDIIFFLEISPFFKSRYLQPLIIIFEPFYAIYVVLTAIAGSFLKFEWKGRVTGAGLERK